MTPPPSDLPIILKIRSLHKNVYVIGEKLNKRDKLGIHREIENLCLRCLALAIEAKFCQPQTKNIPLGTLRIKISVLKNLIRTESELNIINEKTYLRLAEQAVEISKMTSGWLAHATQKEC